MDVRFADTPAYLESRKRGGKIEFYADESTHRYFPLIQRSPLLVVLHEANEVEGVVLAPQAARRAILAPFSRGQNLAIKLLLFGSLLGFLAYGISVGNALIISLSLAFLAAFTALQFYVRGFLLDRAQRVFADMPAPGTPIRMTSSGVTIGSASTPWTVLRLDTVELRIEPTFPVATRCFIQRVQLAAPTGIIWLDAAAIGNGQQILDTVFAKLNSQAT